jgi:nucleoside 2-deoxyribosyltransferase
MGDPTSSELDRGAQLHPISNPESAFKVYVAAAATGDEGARVDLAIAALKAHGFVVTCSWPEVVANTAGGANPRNASHDERRTWTTQDLLEIDQADALWFLVPSTPTTTRGAWFEAGYAYASNKYLVFSGDTKQSVFCALGYEFSTDDAALRHLRWLRERKLDASFADFPASVGSEG